LEVFLVLYFPKEFQCYFFLNSLNHIKITLGSYSAIQPYISCHCFLLDASFVTLSIQICAKSQGLTAPSSNFAAPLATGAVRVGAGDSAGAVRFLDLVHINKC